VLVTYRPPSGAPLLAVREASRPVPVRRQALVVFVGLVALAVLVLAVVPSAPAEPGAVAAKRAEAQAVMGQIHGLDANLEQAVEAFNLANVKLGRIQSDLRENRRELRIAQGNLARARATLEARLVEMYTSGSDNSGFAVLLGARSIEDLIVRMDTVNRVSDQSGRVLGEVKRYRTAVRIRRVKLKEAHVEQARLVAERSAQKASIEGQLAQRQQMLSSIKSEIGRLQEQERARQTQLEAAARARLASPQTGLEVLAASSGSVDSTDQPLPAAPPSRYGGVVGIAMQFLGTPYVYGGSSPSGFDCSGFVMYVYAQIGVSLPHNAAAQYGYGTPVSRSALQPGDLVFFNGLGHNGIYIGGGQFIHSPHTGDVVKISSLSGWYSSTWVGARRL
jgi:cell wall-associated NlpC family hydrolase